mgnify:CR=1 FL=1
MALRHRAVVGPHDAAEDAVERGADGAAELAADRSARRLGFRRVHELVDAHLAHVHAARHRVRDAADQFVQPVERQGDGAPGRASACTP